MVSLKESLNPGDRRHGEGAVGDDLTAEEHIDGVLAVLMSTTFGVAEAGGVPATGGLGRNEEGTLVTSTRWVGEDGGGAEQPKAPCAGDSKKVSTVHHDGLTRVKSGDR